MTKEISAINKNAIESALMDGDLSKLNPDEKLAHYQSVCETIGLNPLTQPFQYITLNGKLKMYALKGATDQLRKIYQINCEITNTDTTEDIYIVTVKVTDSKGRTDEDMGFAKTAGLKGDMLGNAILKAVTKSKRRATLSMCGLGMLDEDEVKSIKEDIGSGWGKKEPIDINAKLEEQVKELQLKTKNSAKVEKVEKVETPLDVLIPPDEINDIKSEEYKNDAINQLKRILNNPNKDNSPLATHKAWAENHLSEFTDMCDYYSTMVSDWQKDMTEADFQEVKDYCIEVKSYFVSQIEPSEEV